jgi:hypothetical protein
MFYKRAALTAQQHQRWDVSRAGRYAGKEPPGSLAGHGVPTRCLSAGTAHLLGGGLVWWGGCGGARCGRLGLVVRHRGSGDACGGCGAGGGGDFVGAVVGAIVV